MNQEIQNNFIVEPFKANLIMGKNFSDFCMEEHPQYKAYNNGYESLTVVELISMIIGTGTKRNVEQARQIYNVMENSLHKLGKSRKEEIQVVQGIGDSKAHALYAAIELGKRYQLEKFEKSPDLGSSLSIYNYLYPKMGTLDHEEFHVLLMNQHFCLIKDVTLSIGGLTETSADIRLIMKEAVLNNATIIAVAHNHPSGCPTPSKNDNLLTQNIRKACELMRIFFMDHLIVCDGTFYSYHDKGKLE